MRFVLYDRRRFHLRGHFWEAINAAGVLQIPLAVFVWDDGYGISVPEGIPDHQGVDLRGIEGHAENRYQWH